MIISNGSPLEWGMPIFWETPISPQWPSRITWDYSNTAPDCTDRSQAAPKVEVLVSWQTFPWRGGAWGITPAERNVATGEKKWGYRLVQLRYRQMGSPLWLLTISIY